MATGVRASLRGGHVGLPGGCRPVRVGVPLWPNVLHTAGGKKRVDMGGKGEEGCEFLRKA